MAVILPSGPQTFTEGFFEGAAATEGLFGGNLLASRGILMGPGSYDEAINGLGVTGLRYPGGSLTEEYFDITNPDATTATSNITGETTDFIPISEFLSYANANGQEVTIVVPTYSQFGEPDENGNRLSNVNEANLREFVHDVVTGVYGEAPIIAIEIGNEYWGSGLMNAVEYGRLSSEMALVIDDELQAVT
jgi:alpha-L-arabinofuranosidase